MDVRANCACRSFRLHSLAATKRERQKYDSKASRPAPPPAYVSIAHRPSCVLTQQKVRLVVGRRFRPRLTQPHLPPQSVGGLGGTDASSVRIFTIPVGWVKFGALLSLGRMVRCPRPPVHRYEYVGCQGEVRMRTAWVVGIFAGEVNVVST